LNSIADGHPGFVSNEYLNAIQADTTIAAAESEAAGIWEHRPGGYFVVADEMVKIAINYNEELDRTPPSARSGSACRASGLGRVRLVNLRALLYSSPASESGPVALMNGGPLGPNQRN
jgi:hypothetical protein